MKKKKRQKIVTIIGCVLLALMIVAAAVTIYLGKEKLDSVRAELEEITTQLEDNTVTCYVATRPIKAGEKLYTAADVDGVTVKEDAVNIELQEEVNSLPEELFMQDDQIGHQTKIDLQEGEPVMASYLAVTEISTDLREFEISTANLMTDQENLDVIDIRILFPDGSDYCVIPKKEVKNLHLDNCVFYTYLNEDEILTYNSAVIDAFLTGGAYIYTTRYVESNMQDAAEPNYPIRPATLAVLNEDPNIIKIAEKTLNSLARTNLQTRLALLTDDQAEAVANGFGIASNGRSAIFQERIEAEAAEAEGESEGEANDLTDMSIGENVSEEEVTDGGLAEVEGADAVNP